MEDAQLSNCVLSIWHEQVRKSQCLEAVHSTFNAKTVTDTTNPRRTVRLSVAILRRFWSFLWRKHGPPLARDGHLAPAGVAACVCEPGEVAQEQRLQICPSTVARRCSDANIGTSCGKRRCTEDVERKRRRGGERETIPTEQHFFFLVRGVSGQHWCLMIKKSHSHQ